MMTFLAQADAAHRSLVENPAGVLAVLFAVLGALFWIGDRAIGRRLFGIVPKLVFCYFVPTLFTTYGVLPEESPLYDWVRAYVLPASLLLLILALDVPGILRLGPRAVIMLLAGTAGVVIGGPIALFVCQGWVDLPAETWRGMTALSGSWIGGGANMIALGEIADVSGEMFGMMVIVDVFVANIWLGVLLYSAGHHERIDRWTGADASAIHALQRRIADEQQRTQRIPTLTDLMLIAALAFAGSWACFVGGRHLSVLVASGAGETLEPVLSSATWKFILVTALGVALSFTRARRLEGAGASRIGTVLLDLLVACIGAGANF